MAVAADVPARNRAVVFALCRRFSLDPAGFLAVANLEEKSIKSLYMHLLQFGSKEAPSDHGDGVTEWITFADTFPIDAKAQIKALQELDGKLSQRSIILGNGLEPSEADTVVFSVVVPIISGLSSSEKERIPNVMRWMDYIQHKEDFGGAFPTIQLEKPRFDPRCIPKRNAREKVAEEKKRQPEKEKVEKEIEVSVSVLNIQVGVIRKAWKHPSADSLLVEEIDVGEDATRQVVSGLAKFFNADELPNRRVVLITNVKPGKLRDVLSAGLVLCASNADHTTVEPLVPPEGAKIGERVTFAGFDGKPEDVLNPKKKQFEKISTDLYTDENGVATYRGVPFMTSAGPCTSSLVKVGIK
ncbi:putative methionine--tRNA ligase [Nymphaea thermarum]|nr:putative methionine--tRNA ligase [Nymphaea thermarum]